MRNFTSSGRQITLFGEENAGSPLVWLCAFEQEGEAVWNACRNLHATAFQLAAVSIRDWNGDLSPWKCARTFKNGEDFAGNADHFLRELTGTIIPEVTAQLSEPPQYHAISGYSLAGLFAVWALYKTDVFRRAVSASGSFWFPEFLEFAALQKFAFVPDAVYFSLGDKEHKTRNPVMATVLERTQAIFEQVQAQGIPTVFERNAGNHFQDPDERTAKGILWMLAI